MTQTRCQWAEKSSELDKEYHDTEWGVPVHDDQQLFEMLCLEGAQAGLSWSTVLKKRENYRKAFDNFDAKKIIQYDQNKIDELLTNTGIIRNKLKIASVIKNAKGFLDIQKEFSSFSKYIWSFSGGKVITHSYTTLSDIPTKTEISAALSKDLKKRGFSFVGSTICYAFMQAIGMVNDHEVSCFRYEEVSL